MAHKRLEGKFLFVCGRFPKEVHSSTFYDLSTFFSTKVNNSTNRYFLKIYRIQMKMFPQTFIGPKYGSLYCNNEVKVHTFSLVNFTSPTDLKSFIFYFYVLFKFLQWLYIWLVSLQLFIPASSLNGVVQQLLHFHFNFR